MGLTAYQLKDVDGDRLDIEVGTNIDDDTPRLYVCTEADGVWVPLDRVPEMIAAIQLLAQTCAHKAGLPCGVSGCGRLACRRGQ